MSKNIPPTHQVFLKIKGNRHYLWRAVDQDGTVLDIVVQSRRNKAAAKKFFAPGAPELLKGCQYVPRVIITGYPRVGETCQLWRGQARDVAERQAPAAQTAE